ncbi:MAG: hypothetical protein BGO11_17475, partial [Solirubrobacterales bacterium 70-9]
MKILRKPKTLLALLALVALTALVSACGGGGSSSESSTSSSGRTVDQAFVAEMIPHHELAVEMAEVAQKEGQHPQITQLANNIVESQSAEIEEMKAIAEEIGATAGAGGSGMEGMSEEGMEGMSEEGSGHEENTSQSEDAKVLGMSMDSMGMSMQMSSLEGAKPFDRTFIDMMVPHHQGAIRMADAEVEMGENSELKDLAKRIVAAQTKEIEEMNEWRED